MRPLRLELQAFGSYAGVQAVDFRLLKDRSLFLIHGPTGSGKSTILDAICFALYGEASGGEREAQQMRSHHADPAVPTEVTFEFALGKEVYRIFRSPEQERPKKRGEGTTRERARATLWRRTGLDGDAGDGAVLADQWSRVSEEAIQLLGFKSRQFRQVVMIPQGKFLELLNAGSRERQAILEVLFQTEIYRRIEEALKAAAKEVRGEAGDLEKERRILLEQASVRTEEELGEKQSDTESRLAALETRLKDLKAGEMKAQERWQEARDTQNKYEELRRAEAECGMLLNRKGTIDAMGKRLVKAQAALSLGDLESELRKRDRELEEAALKRTEAERALQSARSEKQEAEKALLYERASRLLAMRREWSSASKVHENTLARLKAVEDELSQARCENESLDKALHGARAAFLARELASGSPCPVCGSTEHPSPATFPGELPSEELLGVVRKRVKELERRREETLRKSMESEKAVIRLDSKIRSVENRTGLETLVPDELERYRGSAGAAKEQALDRALKRHAQADRGLSAREEALRAFRQGEDTARNCALTVRGSFIQRLQKGGFQDEADFQASRLGAAEMERLALKIQDHAGELRTARDRAERARESAAGLKETDIAPFERAVENMKAQGEETREQRGAALEKSRRIAQCLEALQKISRKRTLLEKRYAIVGKLADAACGANPLGITFQRFVLAALLDDVLSSASHRLRRMSGGRYELKRARNRTDLRSAGGLDLEVFDAHTGTVRMVNTLSGGEGFLASLSLALGLADVVQSHAGGVRLETIFVDEGFGSLDDETLDLAFRALVDLQGAGRLVGIISHVQELKERIEARLEVIPGSGGSRARFVL
jgi:exonuclease SbcC